MALFKIEKGLSSNLTENRPNTNEGWCYFTTDDGKFYIDTDTKTGDTSGRIALNANKAELLKSPTDGSVAGIDWTGSANNAEYFAVWDSTTHNNPYIRAMNAENMRANLNVPTRTGGNASGDWGINITGNAATATKLTTATAGDANTPVYFKDGKPVATDTLLNVNINGNAATSSILGTQAVGFYGVKNVTPALIGQENNVANWAIERDSTSYQLIEHFYDNEGNYVKSAVGLNAENYSNYAMPTAHWAWAGQDGQPAWVWGGNNFQEYRVWNPANFSVKSATTASSVPWTGITGKPSTFTPSEHTHSYLPLAGGTLTGALTIDTGNSSGSVKIFEDAEGGSIAITSKSGTYTYEIDSYNDQEIRMHTASKNPNGAYKTIKWNGKTGMLTADGFTGPLTGNATSATSSTYISNIKPSDQTPSSKIMYIAGGYTLGTGDNQIQLDGTNASTTTISAPSAGCYNNGTSGNVQIVRFGWNQSNSYWTELFMSPNHDGFWHGSVKNGTRSSWKRMWMQGDSVTGAVWNDYAEYRESDCEEFGRVLIENGDDTLSVSTERLQQFAGISSDTWGFCQGETEKAKTPIAVAGRVLVYPYRDRNEYKPGDAVCAAPNGTVDIMTEEEIAKYPHRIVGTVSCVPTYEQWGSGDRDPVKVNGRIWVKVR